MSAHLRLFPCLGLDWPALPPWILPGPETPCVKGLIMHTKYSFDINHKQAQLEVPHSEIQVELDG